MQNKVNGSFTGKDKYGVPVVVEYLDTTMLAPEFSVAMQGAWEVAKPAYTIVEMSFLRRHPELVGKESYFKSFEPLFEQGLEKVDWKLVEVKMQEMLKSFFVFDASQFPESVAKTFAADHYFFVSVKNKSTGELLGFITFLRRPTYALGEVKATVFAVDPQHQSRGLGKLLMSSIFRIMPDVKRIFLSTRVTNDVALKAYSSWGFVMDEHPVQDPHHVFNKEHWACMEYKVDQSNVLLVAAVQLN
jgi:GNAT superfamily N-acetyltransferase